MCGHTEEIGKQQSPARVKAQPQKKRAVRCVESAETQDYVSEPQGLEEIDDEMEELTFIHPEYLQRAAMGPAHVRQQMQ